MYPKKPGLSTGPRMENEIRSLMPLVGCHVFPCCQLVRADGPLLWYYSNVYRGKRKKSDQDELIPSVLEPDGSSKEYRKNWARLIQKIYEVDPLTCPKCQGQMRIISFIQDEEVIQKILKHPGLWLVKPRVPPRANAPPRELEIDYSDSQVPLFEEYVYKDPDYSIDTYLS